MNPKKPLEVQVGKRLRERGWTLAVAESCTGGLLGHLITEVPGSSDYFMGGILAYSDQAKANLLQVRTDSLEQYGAVSEQVASEMAIGVRALLQTSSGLSVTGIAGPGGGTDEKPVGLTFIGLSSPQGVVVEKHIWQGTRSENKLATARAALTLLLRVMGQGE